MDAFQPYRQQIGAALRQLLELANRKKEIEQQMSKLRNLIVANANMLPDSERAVFIKQAEDSISAGFTATIRELFRTNPKGLSPTILRDKLIESGFDLNSQSNPLASIHSVIRRLLENEEIERYGAADLGIYRWKQATPGILKRRLEENLKR